MTSHAELMWAQEAAGETPCQSAPDLYFPDLDQDISPLATLRLAKTMCGECPIRVQCLNYAVANEEGHGVWGGTTPKERSKIRRALRPGSLASESRLGALVS